MTGKLVSDEKTLSWHPYHTRLNFEFKIIAGEMTGYIIQLEYNDGSYVEPDWKQVARSDTSHDYFHIDFHFADGEKEQQTENLPQNLPPDESIDVRRVYSSEMSIGY